MRNFKKHIGLFSIIILVFIVAYTAYFINKNNIANQSFIVNKQNISFSSLPSNFNDYKILEIADLHSMKFGENNEKLISEINKLSPDIIFVTGDMFSAYQFKKDDGTYLKSMRLYILLVTMKKVLIKFLTVKIGV